MSINDPSGQQYSDTATESEQGEAEGSEPGQGNWDDTGTDDGGGETQESESESD